MLSVFVVYYENIVNVPCVKTMFFASSICFKRLFSKYCKRISAIVLEMGIP